MRWEPFEEEARGQGFQVIAGLDEAGRGPLAGPVVAAAVVFPNIRSMKGIDDSKALSAEQRERDYPFSRNGPWESESESWRPRRLIA